MGWPARGRGLSAKRMAVKHKKVITVYTFNVLRWVALERTKALPLPKLDMAMLI